MTKYVAPQSGLKSFTCPHCGVLARHYHWGYGNAVAAPPVGEKQVEHAFVRVSKCEHCSQICLWYGAILVYPNRGAAPLPNPHMPPEVRKDYEEAATIATVSPRGAAALLRLAIQKLCVHLGGKGENVNADVALLVRKGLPVTVQQALDVVRVTGNNAVHPGQIVTDDAAVAGSLFPLVNVIVEYMIDLPHRVGELYEALPESARAAIEKRDGRA